MPNGSAPMVIIGATITELATTASVNLAVIDLDRYIARCRPSDRKLFDDYLEGYPLEEIAARRAQMIGIARRQLPKLFAAFTQGHGLREA